MEYRYRRIVRIMVIMTTILVGVVLSSVHTGQMPYQSSDTAPGLAFMDSSLAQTDQDGRSNSGQQEHPSPSPETSSLAVRPEARPQAHVISGMLHQSQTWQSGQTYVLYGQVVIPVGVQIVVEPGAQITSYDTVSAAIVIKSGGSLVMRGTPDSQVSLAGMRAKPNAAAIAVDGGSFTADHARITGFDRAVQVSSASTVALRESYLQGSVIAPYPITMQDNVVQAIGLYPFAIDLRGNTDVSGIALGGLHANILVGKGAARLVAVAGAKVPLASDWTVSGNSRAVLCSDGALIVEGNLTLMAGAVVKTQNGSAVIARDGSRIVAQGEDANPVVFTSYRDDMIADDSDGDGPSAGTVGDYLAVLERSGVVTVSWQNVRVLYASTCAANEPDASGQGQNQASSGQDCSTPNMPPQSAAQTSL